MKVAVAADCYGYPMKMVAVQWLRGQGHDVVDAGSHSMTPDGHIIAYADAVAGAVSRGEVDRGVLLCMSGGMMGIRANRWPQVRAVMALDQGMIAHDRTASNANVLCVAAVTESAVSLESKLAVFMDTPFDALERRVQRLAALEGVLSDASGK